MKKSNSIFLKNTLMIIICTFVIKLIGMISKIIETRILGETGMQIYVLSYPTILLFSTIASFSFSQIIPKMIAVKELTATSKDDNLKILKSSLSLSLKISLILIIIYLSSIYFIAKIMLKEEKLFYPFLFGAPLIMLIGIADILKGYYNGLKRVKIAANANMIEQLIRTLFSLIFLFLFHKINLLLTICLLIISLSLGELASIIYSLLMLKSSLKNIKHLPDSEKMIFKEGLSLTAIKMIGSLTFFLEPIIYTFILTKKGITADVIHQYYTIVDAYIIPILTCCSFLPSAISTVITPNIAQNYASSNYKEIKKITKKSLNLIFVVSAAILLLLSFYSSEFIYLLYKTTLGSSLLKFCAFFFIFYYLQVLNTNILLAIGHTKLLMINSLFTNFLKLILIIIFASISYTSLYAIIISVCITISVNFIINCSFLMHALNIKFKIKHLFSYLIPSIFLMAIILLLKVLNINYIITSAIIFFISLLLFKKYFTNN